MTLLRSFTFQLWEIFVGNLLLLLCSLLYLAWWVVSFRPHSAGGSAGAAYIITAFITGCLAIGLMSSGINSLSGHPKGVPVIFILAGGVAMFIILLLATSLGFHRAVTSELLIMHVWAVLELSAVAVLYGTGRLGAGRAAAMAALVGMATLLALVCYALYYRLDAVAQYYIGMAPLAADAAVMAVFLALLALS
ncbi:MAG TPA: hypothetical protein PLM53_09820 [Spirochaetota bacterium]|nr:hypothetical protein [Spirochaetota bacterium]HPC40900.1 hypothetical protein [Spirochaetota bacterium]HPL19004.1 hypothetical protein [Spirochaetota bacterium]HQF08670.1 hypothetical protein [Spirochaetota bacterium]HQH97385.1 hypothetical protein [Spirochaetota bacterium]